MVSKDAEYEKERKKGRLQKPLGKEIILNELVPEMPDADTGTEPSKIDIEALHIGIHELPCMLIEPGVPCKVTRATTKLK